jgi:hypothetical protein
VDGFLWDELNRLVCRIDLRKVCYRDYNCVVFTARGDVVYCPVYLAVKFPKRKVKVPLVPQVALVFGNGSVREGGDLLG